MKSRDRLVFLGRLAWSRSLLLRSRVWVVFTRDCQAINRRPPARESRVGNGAGATCFPFPLPRSSIANKKRKSRKFSKVLLPVQPAFSFESRPGFRNDSISAKSLAEVRQCRKTLPGATTQSSLDLAQLSH